TIRDLKDQTDGNIYVSGSGTLVRAMLADGLVDDLHLFVYPLTHGGGQRLFADTAPAAKFALAGSEAYSNGVLYLTYSLAAPGHESPAPGNEARHANCEPPPPTGRHKRLRARERARHVLRDPRRRISAGPVSRRHGNHRQLLRRSPARPRGHASDRRGRT